MFSATVEILAALEGCRIFYDQMSAEIIADYLHGLFAPGLHTDLVELAEGLSDRIVKVACSKL